MSGPDVPEGDGELTHAAALACSERRLVKLQARLADRPTDGPSHLRVAALEQLRANLLAATTYESQEPDLGTSHYVQWRQRFLQSDPRGSVSRVAQAAEAALQAGEKDRSGQRLPASSRRQALLLLAWANATLGDDRSEAEALAEAVQYEPEEVPLWRRLAEAYGRARQFKRAEAAYTRMLELLEDAR
jgi:hypothetical protein